MPDLEKVIKGLNEIGAFITGRLEYGQAKNFLEFLDESIALLKEQEAKPIVYTDNPYTGLPVAHCPKCGRFARQFHMAQPGEETHFCPWCGQEVKWDG